MTRLQRNGHSAACKQTSRSLGGGLFLGIVIGLVAGLVLAAGIVWYLNAKPSQFKTTEQAPLVLPPVPETVAEAPGSVASAPAAAQPAYTEKALINKPPAAPASKLPQAERTQSAPTQPAEPKPVVNSPPPAEPDFTFFDLLPGETSKASKPNDEQTSKASKPARASEVWWLQVAALKAAKDADRLKARLALLGLPVQTQQVTSGEVILHRVRAGPFKTEDEALSALNTLTENGYQPQLLKEKLQPR